jgi:hypothetical protein
MVIRPLLLAFLVFTATAAVPPGSLPPAAKLQRSAPPLPLGRGEVINVATPSELADAAVRVKPGGIILLADGHYLLPRCLRLRTDGITLRGATGRRERVVLDGAQCRDGELVALDACAGVTIAHLTVQNVRHNGIKINSDSNVQRVLIYDCVLHNIWQRAIKGVRVPEENREAVRPADCAVKYCVFYNDRPKRFADDPADTPANFDGNYVGGIDVMYPKSWVISDNVFVGIQGRTRGGRGAVFLWHEAEDCVVERNVMVDCDVGVALGNSHKPADVPVHATRCTVRNNFVVRAPETGVLADYTRDCLIAHNTIYDPTNRLRRLIRLVHENEGLRVINNLLSGPELRNETTSKIELKGNLAGDFTSAFVNPELGDLHLQESPGDVVHGGIPLEEVRDDIDLNLRDAKPDVGADERRSPEEKRS